ncbi:MAG: asparagine synthase (glutamine-hydrolyzing) [Desulfarculales bacterium]|jgi:asparagine synthase (glutamine-hydrolysing)|nr:asparagine synthase (glutamine-hydrolyzing) [Desulfarculales bacterium]
MCGIFGIIDHEQSREALSLIVEAALGSMLNRGPDGQGVWGCGGQAHGMRRLAIVDIEGGAQPFFSAAGQVVVFQNGEIYNFSSLKKELNSLGYRFCSNCDTEVLAHGYAEWGMAGLLNRLDGMFAIAIYDQRIQRLLLARDRYGEKPLYWTQDGQKFAYSSTMLPLAALPWVAAGFSTWGLHRYLCLGFTPGDQTLCRGIKRLLPGCWMEISGDTGEVAIQKYHEFSPAAPHERDWSPESLEDELVQAVKSRLIADVPVGLFLSGGIDSSLLAYFAAREHRGINTFSIGFADAAYDESVHAKAVARHIGSLHHHFLFDESAFFGFLPQVAAALDDPVGDQACLPLFLLSTETRKFVTVALSGEGADEIFGGYFYYKAALAGGQPASCSLMHGCNSATPAGFPHMMNADVAATWLELPLEEDSIFEHELAAWLACCPDRLRRAKLCDIRTWLTDDLLIKLDRMGMAASIEGRAPYLAVGLEHWLNLTPSDSIGNDMPKYPLRLLAEKYLPRSVWDRPKQGFILPMRQWLRTWFQHHGVKTFFIEYSIEGLHGPSVAKWIGARLEDSAPGWERLMFSLLMLHVWNRQFQQQMKALNQQYISAGI